MTGADLLPWRSRRWPWGLILLLVPLLLALAWGTLLSDTAYALLQAAQALGDQQAPALRGGQITQAPLWVAFLALFGSYAPQAALLGSALGWGATAGALFISLRSAGRNRAAVIAALLLLFSPIMLRTSGTPLAWVPALGWAAAALAILSWPLRQAPTRAAHLVTLLLLLLLGLHFSAATVLLALTLLAILRYRGLAGWWPLALLALVSLLWGLLAIPRFGALPLGDMVWWWQRLAGSVAAYPLTWLFLPFVLLGAWDVWTWETAELGAGAARSPAPPSAPYMAPQQFLGLLFLWVLAALLARDTATPILLAVVGIALAGLGVAWLARRLLGSERFGFDRRRATTLLPALLVIPLLLVSLANLRALFAGRPLSQAQLQQRAARWIHENTDARATLYAPPRVGYLSGRPSLPAMVDRIHDASVATAYDQLLALSPDYVVSENSMAWDYITRTTWFADHYRARESFSDGYATDSPVTIWAQAGSALDSGEAQEMRAVVDDRFALVGYRFEPAVITPGEDIYLTLSLQALRPVSHGFITGIHLTTPDGWVWAWREEQTPRSFAGQWWEPGQIIPESLRLQTTEDIPLAAYDLQVFWRAADEKSNWPVVRDGDQNVLDRVFLGHVLAPPAEQTVEGTPVEAQFGDAIRLAAAKLSPAVPGEPLAVSLTWEALRQPAADYTVFVHLVDETGRILAAHDGMPAGGRFPTGAWQPGLIIKDTHVLALPADLAPGAYRVNVGLYLLQSGERLPVRDAQGMEEAERSLPLATVAVED